MYIPTWCSYSCGWTTLFTPQMSKFDVKISTILSAHLLQADQKVQAVNIYCHQSTLKTVKCADRWSYRTVLSAHTSKCWEMLPPRKTTSILRNTDLDMSDAWSQGQKNHSLTRKPRGMVRRGLYSRSGDKETYIITRAKLTPWFHSTNISVTCHVHRCFVPPSTSLHIPQGVLQKYSILPAWCCRFVFMSSLVSEILMQEQCWILKHSWWFMKWSMG